MFSQFNEAKIKPDSYYGSSMKYFNGSEKTLLGINIGILGFGIAFMLLLFVILKKESRRGVN